MVKISARSDKIKGGLSVSQSGPLLKNSVLRKTQNTFSLSTLKKNELSISFMNVVAVIFYGESDGDLERHMACVWATSTAA